MSVCALGHPLMEGDYLRTIAKHTAGPHGKRGVDTLAAMFGNLVMIVEKTRSDVLGDLFQGSITYGERGQYMTPEPICQMMARMSLPQEKTGLEGRRAVCDPLCGAPHNGSSVALAIMWR
ncbi:MAG: SAM-dependent DNA methyltransferase [Planctomycetaceae bacterium]|nr:SAM-dependent DNA methyltransferase [Planctomycetaceae bacterium]